MNEEQILERLIETIKKLSNIGETQRYRFQEKWNEYLDQLDSEPHLIRKIPFDEERFRNDLEYRINTLKTISDAFVDGYYSIKSLLKALYHNYFESEEFKTRYSQKDAIKIQYIVAKEILGNLVQYNKLDHKTVPLKYNIMARNYTILKMKPKTDTALLKNINKIFTKEPLLLSKIHQAMEEVEKDGLILIKKQDDGYIYELKEELTLSSEGENIYNQNLAPLISWPTQLWRSFYNIRELNVTPTENVRYHNFLQKVLSRSATQGFSPANFVMKNLKKYYTTIRDSSD